ncbi:GNAT family N-acetyltransferase [Paenibacillus mucilaginosus]|uniref:GCN5-related N-acetyltransferase n=1 Tax=Paenibacillus mucilaginosus (strain KNP414) TaxID=1036673 RepID=F8FMN4_PAEMK|nr:GNAT family N-acetyltransferase [Paenibacillus mucilaginosus]AEI44205.1 GCN5-related N-acetyltransferase [Paenibacillus mucilaginosus KNP414]MCG7216619.1 GNAT family N-acetyltransferase [Paenibacillus mucilaginosus]WDM25618.1 GNAT family N-acetyltransferase [Paenibacillus mucilaginosus]
MNVKVERLLTPVGMSAWKEAFALQQIPRPDEYYELCLAENAAGERVTLFACADGRILGAAHLKYRSDYPPFGKQGIPEINDLNVFPEYRRRGIANLLIGELERAAGDRHEVIGIGVGLYADYGAAQRLYSRRGYIPDGRGVMYANRPVVPGSQVSVDDDLVLYLTKRLSAGGAELNGTGRTKGSGHLGGAPHG